MLHIILLFLKIIGILLLCVLGLILLLLLLTLFVPVRYRVALEHGEDLFYVKGRVNWLLHLVHVRVSHIDGVLHIKARLFGFVVYDNLKKNEPKPPKEKSKKIKKRKAKVNKAKKVNSKARPTKTDPSKDGKIKEVKMKEDKLISEMPKDNLINTEIQIDAEEKNLQVVTSVIKSENNSNTIVKSSISEKVNPITKIENSGNTNDKVSQYEMKPNNNKVKETFFGKIWKRLLGIKAKIKLIFEGVVDKIRSIFNGIASLKNKWDLILNFLRDEMNKEGMHLTFVSLKKLIKHVLPNKVDSKLIFGTGDPCSTGQALGAMSILYSFYGDKIRITPDFERNRLEGQHDIRGRIRLVTILIIVVKLILDKRFKQLKNNFNILKEAL